MRSLWRPVGVLLLALLASACDVPWDVAPETTEPEGSGEVVAPDVPDESPVLARVGDAVIREVDLAHRIASMLDENTAAALDAEARREVLESMVATLAISQVRERELTSRSLDALERDVASFREGQLVRSYLSAHTRVPPVTDGEVRAYYEANAERFTEPTERLYAVVLTPQPVPQPEQSRYLELLSTAPEDGDWASWRDTLVAQGLAVSYRQGLSSDGQLSARLTDQLTRLEEGEVAPPVLVDGRIFVLRLEAIREGELRPLEEVSARIRELLTPRHVERAFEEATYEVLQQVDVVYSAEN